MSFEQRMRVAVLADVHGNAPALRAVLAEIDRDPVDPQSVAAFFERSAERDERSAR